MLWTISGSVNFGGKSAAYTRSVETESGIDHEVTLTAGLAGVLTRSDADTGVATLAEGHGFETLDVLDCYWSGGQRLGMDATVDGNDVTVDGGVGDDLPAVAGTAVVVSARSEIDTDFDGDKVAIIVVAPSLRASAKFEANDDTHHLSVDVPSGGLYEWDEDSLAACPIAGDVIGKIYASAGTAVETTIRIGVGYDS